MLSKVGDFHGGGYEERRFLVCEAVWLLKKSTFRKNVSLPSSR
jgi:hypothetical protein